MSSGPGDKMLPRPPWWHEDLAARVRRMEERQEESFAVIRDQLHGVRDEINQFHGMRRMFGGLIAFLTLVALIAPTIVALTHH